MTTQDKIEAISAYFTTPIKRIEHVIPYHPICKPFTAYRWLIIIAGNPGCTVTGMRDLYTTNTRTIVVAVDRLVQLGFVRQVQKPRWVVALHAWKVEKVYEITYSGKKVLSELL